MSKKLSELSIFFPFWNEEANIEEVITRAISEADKLAAKWEILMIDDGSVDKTLDIAKKLSNNDERLRVISHHPNRGYGSSLREGFTNSNYEFIAFTDGDGQFDISEMEKFVIAIQNADIVIGFRKRRKDPFVRHLLMNLLKVWDYLLFHFHFKDIDCGFKMFRRSALESIMPLRSEGAMITTEILSKATIKKLKIKQVGVEHYPRLHGKPTGANIPVVVRAVLESFILWWDLKNGRF